MARYITLNSCDSLTSWNLDTNGDGTGSLDTSIKEEGSAAIKYVRTIDKVRNRTCTLRYTFPTDTFGYKVLVFKYRWSIGQNQLKVRFVTSSGSALTSQTVATDATAGTWHTAFVPLHGIALENVNRLDIFNDGDQYTGWTEGQTVSLWLDDIKFQSPERRNPSRRAIVLQFDDGYKDNLDTALPLFQRYGHVATIGMVTSFFDTTYLGLEMLSTSELQTLANAGWEVASHTVNHTNMFNASSATILTEMRDSKAALQALGYTVNHFIYPFTQWKAASYTESQNYYESARIGTPPNQNLLPGQSTMYGNVDKYLLNGQSVTVNTTAAEVKKWIDDAIRYGTLLVIYFHDINSAGGANSCTAATLEEILRYLNAQNIRTMTTTGALTEWGFV